MIITAGAKSVPTTLKNQLKIGGILVIPIGDDNTQKMFRITRVSEKEFKKEEFANFRFVPFLKGTNKK